MKVLMATDGSAQAEAALQAATQLLTRSDELADVVCVLPGPPAGWDEPTRRDRYHRKLQAEAHSRLDSAKRLLARAGWSARPLTQVGSPGAVLVELSANYDVTVVGAIGHRAQSDLPLGPVASRLVEHGAGSILIVRGAADEEALRVLVPVDGEGSLDALDRLNQLTWGKTLELTLLHVVETPWLHLGLEQEWFGYQERNEERGDEQAVFEKSLRTRAATLLEKARDRWPERHTTVDVLTKEGNPAREIVAEVEQGAYDLIVMSAGGSGAFKRQMLGSVSASVARLATCSVLLVRPGITSV